MTRDAADRLHGVHLALHGVMRRNVRLGADLADAAGNPPRLAALARERAMNELAHARTDWKLLRALHRLSKLAEGAA